jgi:hypothetical protein
MQPRIRLANQRRRYAVRSAVLDGTFTHHTPSNGSATDVKDLREHRRYAVAETFLRVTWLDTNGDMKVEHDARPIDISETGMAIQLPEAALVLSQVRMETGSGELLGHGKVRYCRPMGSKYIVGIEFTGSLRWQPPEGPITEPIPLTAPPSEEEFTSGNDLDNRIAADIPEELLWSDAPIARPAMVEPDEPESLQEVKPQMATPARPDAFMPPVPELHLSLDSNADQGFFARLPMLVKAGALVLVALALGSFFLGRGRTTGDGKSSIVGEQGWITEWASDAAGSRRGRQLTLYRPSTQLSDYQMQFTGQIENKALGWVFRAADTNNYYGMKIEQDKPGSVHYTRFAVVNGRESSVTEKSLPIAARADTAYNVRLEVNGPRFSVYIQDEPVELWADNRLKSGAVGFMNEAQEQGRTSAVRISFQRTANGQ